jgi:hypothetical protein
VIFLLDDGARAHVINLNAEPSLVILLPITRTSNTARANWAKILEILETSEIKSLVVIDKTPKKEATLFFRESFKFDEIDLYILHRPSSEPIYDSQGYVTIDNGLWILQLHDDDQWTGSLALPKDAQEYDLFSTNFYFTSNSNSESINWDESPPARINFTLLPSQVWNQFANFIRFQGDHAAGSVDYTLNLVSRLICRHRSIVTLDYYYDNRHWQNRRQSSKNLRKLAIQDGWSGLASVEIQLLNRSIDNLAALSFFKELIPKDKLKEATLNLMKTFYPTLKRRILTIMRHQLFLILESILSCLIRINNSTTLRNYQSQLESYQRLNRIIKKSWKIESKIEILQLIQEFQDSQDHPLLTKRFAFWKAMLA